MSFLARLAERRIQEAMEDGAFDDLPGAGQPLPDRMEADGLDPVTRAGYRAMAEAGAVPEELALRRALQRARADLAAAADPEARRHLMARVAELGMRHAMAQEARLRGRR
ncbi:DnaJ family domain-containing protein [Roseivivax sp. CAU 1761]